MVKKPEKITVQVKVDDSELGQAMVKLAEEIEKFKVKMIERRAEKLAQRFHEHYERLAPDYGYRTRVESAVPWNEVPETNKKLMIAVATEIIKEDIYSHQAP